MEAMSGLHPEISVGMSLRDWIAGQALASMGAWTPGPHPQDVQTKAAWAYDMADAMLAARKEGQGGGA